MDGLGLGPNGLGVQEVASEIRKHSESLSFYGRIACVKDSPEKAHYLLESFGPEHLELH